MELTPEQLAVLARIQAGAFGQLQPTQDPTLTNLVFRGETPAAMNPVFRPGVDRAPVMPAGGMEGTSVPGAMVAPRPGRGSLYPQPEMLPPGQMMDPRTPVPDVSSMYRVPAGPQPSAADLAPPPAPPVGRGNPFPNAAVPQMGSIPPEQMDPSATRFGKIPMPQEFAGQSIGLGPDGFYNRDQMGGGSAVATNDAPAPAQGGGFLGGLFPGGEEGKARFQDLMLGLAMGAGGTWQDSLAMGAKNVAVGKITRAEEKKAAQSLNATQRLALSKGLSEEEVAAFGDDGKGLLQYTIDRSKTSQPEMTSDMKEYAFARSQGFKGTFEEYVRRMKEAGRTQVNVDTGVKLPSGYQWVDPQDQSKGVRPIPGGPAEAIAAETAGRIGLANDALPQLGAAEQAARQGDLTGPVDYFYGRMGWGKQGELVRELTAGSEALTRMLTGAGMNMSEAQREVDLYLPSPTDRAEDLTSKIQQLQRRLEEVSRTVKLGRGGSSADAPASPAAPAKPRLRYNPQTGALE